MFPWPSLKTLAQPITIRPFFSPSIPWNTTAISHKFPKRKHQMPLKKKCKQSHWSKDQLFLNSFRRSSNKFPAKCLQSFGSLHKIDKVLELQLVFTEFLHYKVLTKSTKFKNRNNKTKFWKLTVHWILQNFGTTKFLQSIEPLDIWTKLWTFIKLWTSFGILQSCYQVIEFERFYKAFTKVFDAYKLSTKFRSFSICVKTL